MVILIQNTQNREMKALNLKINELIKSSPASNSMINIESLTEEQLEHIKRRYL